MHWDKPRCNQIFSSWIPNIFLLLHLLSHWCVCLCIEFWRLTAECLWEDPPCLSSSLWSSLLLQLTVLSFSSSHACCCIDRSTNNWLVPTKQTENKPKWDAFIFPYYNDLSFEHLYYEKWRDGLSSISFRIRILK